ncbi:MAG: hypothetical protein DRN24_06510 [Thermoplasmata archaeon]|nr:MAG: hypothetical protein DRN24_06510 [Thermoplasmata archaeon]
MVAIKKIAALSFLITFLLISPIFSLPITAGECKYGTMYAWYSKDNVHWEKATVHNIRLKRGEPFYIKVNVTTKKDNIWACLKLWETGEKNAENSSFEVLEGPCNIYEILNMHTIPKKNTEYTYMWMMRVKADAYWAGGNAPLNVRVQFNENDDISDDIYFTIANIYIIDKLWENYTIDDKTINTPVNNSNTTPDFETIILLISLLLITILLLYKKIKN